MNTVTMMIFMMILTFGTIVKSTPLKRPVYGNLPTYYEAQKMETHQEQDSKKQQVIHFHESSRMEMEPKNIGPEYSTGELGAPFENENWKRMKFSEEERQSAIQKWNRTFCSFEAFKESYEIARLECEENRKKDDVVYKSRSEQRRKEIAEKCKDARCKEIRSKESDGIYNSDSSAIANEQAIKYSEIFALLGIENKRLSKLVKPVPGCIESLQNTKSKKVADENLSSSTTLKPVAPSDAPSNSEWNGIGNSYLHKCESRRHDGDEILVHQQDFRIDLHGNSSMDVVFDIILDASIEIICLEVIPSVNSVRILNGGHAHQFVRLQLTTGQNFSLPYMIKVWGKPRVKKSIHEVWHEKKYENSTMEHWILMKQENFSTEVLDVFQPLVRLEDPSLRNKRKAQERGHYKFGSLIDTDDFLYQHNIGIGSESNSNVEAKFEVTLNKSFSITFIELTPYNENCASFVEILEGGINQHFVEMILGSNGKHGLSYIIGLWGKKN